MRLPPPRPPAGTPITDARDWHAPSVLRPESVLREARRQKGLRAAPVPQVCVLDPDGDLIRYVEESGAQRVYTVHGGTKVATILRECGLDAHFLAGL